MLLQLPYMYIFALHQQRRMGMFLYNKQLDFQRLHRCVFFQPLQHCASLGFQKTLSPPSSISQTYMHKVHDWLLTKNCLHLLVQTTSSNYALRFLRSITTIVSIWLLKATATFQQQNKKCFKEFHSCCTICPEQPTVWHL